MLLEKFYSVLEMLCRLEIEGIRGSLHRILVLFDDIVDSSGQQADYFLYVRIVFLLGNQTGTAASALAQMKVQTRAELTSEYGIRRYVVVAGPQRISTPEEIQKNLGVGYRTIWSEISGPVPHNPPCKEYFRERIGRDAYPGICLGVFEKDVVAWLVLLDEVVLQQKGIRFRVHDRILQIGNLGNKYSRLGIEPFRRYEILVNTLEEILRLAHIYHISLGVIVSIYSGGMWQ